MNKNKLAVHEYMFAYGMPLLMVLSGICLFIIFMYIPYCTEQQVMKLTQPAIIRCDNKAVEADNKLLEIENKIKNLYKKYGQRYE